MNLFTAKSAMASRGDQRVHTRVHTHTRTHDSNGMKRPTEDTVNALGCRGTARGSRPGGAGPVRSCEAVPRSTREATDFVFFHLYHFLAKVELFFFFCFFSLLHLYLQTLEQAEQSSEKGRPGCRRVPRGRSRPPGSGPRGRSAAGLAVDVVHVHLEVVVSRELLVAKLTFCQRTIGVVGHLVSDQHLLQAEGQVTHLQKARRFQSDPAEAV